jgi:hypothetical protein
MSTIPIHLEPIRSRSISLLKSAWDLPLIGLAFLQGTMLLLSPSSLLVALGMWWAANTIAHNFIHRPFFSSRFLNRIFSFYLSLIIGIPQSLWRSRHLAHHAELEWKLRMTPQVAIESLGLLAMWSLIAMISPRFFLISYIPAYFAGLCLCWLQGRYEHARGTTSHYGRLYNLLFFNDGFHVEHHARPGVHWHDLSHQSRLDNRPSHWPAVLRWVERILSTLERLVLIAPFLQRFVLQKHESAFRKLLVGLPPQRIAVIGGGLFPRSLIILQKIFPKAHLTAIEADQQHIEIAKSFVAAEFINQWFDQTHCDCDLLVIPLAFLGDRSAIYQNPPAKTVLIHDWLWRKSGPSAIVSVLLLKRLNLVTQ